MLLRVDSEVSKAHTISTYSACSLSLHPPSLHFFMVVVSTWKLSAAAPVPCLPAATLPTMMLVNSPHSLSKSQIKLFLLKMTWDRVSPYGTREVTKTIPKALLSMPSK